jgi:hypothetical protein
MGGFWRFLDSRNTPFARKPTNVYTKGTYIDDIEGLGQDLGMDDIFHEMGAGCGGIYIGVTLRAEQSRAQQSRSRNKSSASYWPAYANLRSVIVLLQCIPLIQA